MVYAGAAGVEIIALGLNHSHLELHLTCTATLGQLRPVPSLLMILICCSPPPGRRITVRAARNFASGPGLVPTLASAPIPRNK